MRGFAKTVIASVCGLALAVTASVCESGEFGAYGIPLYVANGVAFGIAAMWLRHEVWK